jgi:hypothetical protein
MAGASLTGDPGHCSGSGAGKARKGCTRGEEDGGGSLADGSEFGGGGNGGRDGVRERRGVRNGEEESERPREGVASADAEGLGLGGRECERGYKGQM